MAISFRCAKLKILMKGKVFSARCLLLYESENQYLLLHLHTYNFFTFYYNLLDPGAGIGTTVLESMMSPLS